MTKQTYRLDVSKIKTLKDTRNILDGMNLITYYDPEDPEDENYHLREYFTILQGPQGLTFSEEPKGIEHYQKELDDKFEELLVKTKMKFSVSQKSAEYHYNKKFDRIIENFEYAVRNGNFPKITLYGVDGSALISSSNNFISVSSTFPEFEVKPHGNNAGYFTFGTIRVWEKTKPSLWVRTFIKFFFGVIWKDA